MERRELRSGRDHRDPVRGPGSATRSANLPRTRSRCTGSGSASRPPCSPRRGPARGPGLRARARARSTPASHRCRGARGPRRPCAGAGLIRPPGRGRDLDPAIDAAARPTDDVPSRISSRPRVADRGSSAPCAVRYASGSAARTPRGQRRRDRHQQRVGHHGVLRVAAVEPPPPAHPSPPRPSCPQAAGDRWRPPRFPRTRCPAPAGTSRRGSAPGVSSAPTGSGPRRAPAPGSSLREPPAPAPHGSPAPPARPPGRKPPLQSSHSCPALSLGRGLTGHR